MKVITLSLTDSSFTNREQYLDYIYKKLKPTENPAGLLVFPGSLGLLLAYRFGELGTPDLFVDAYRSYQRFSSHGHEEFLSLHQELAAGLSLFMVCGTALKHEKEACYIVSHLISPEGELLGSQKQLYLSREERSLGITRGEDLEVFSTPLGKIGLVVGTDAFYPEVGRILALKGAEIVCHSGALSPEEGFWRQMSGMWPQVQQNQFFCVESQLVSNIAHRVFQGSSFILAPCEMTDDKSGFLARGGLTPEPVKADLDFEARDKVIQGYPLLKLLNPAAYGQLGFPGKGV